MRKIISILAIFIAIAFTSCRKDVAKDVDNNSYKGTLDLNTTSGDQDTVANAIVNVHRTKRNTISVESANSKFTTFECELTKDYESFLTKDGKALHLEFDGDKLKFELNSSEQAVYEGNKQ